ncbi:MAG: hypothetical protein ALAOOOJD_01180 [bacterium]|nr:hypothetical protein [bacterium]
MLARATPAQPQTAPMSRQAVISVESPQPGLPILIDGNEFGFTPLQNFSLPPGKHEIAVKRSQPESWLDFDWVEICSLAAGDTVNFVAKFQRGYSLNSTPFDAEVYVAGVLQGTTPLVLRLPEDEIAPVEIRKSGYQSEFLQIGKTNAGRAETRLYAVTLKPEQNLVATREFEKAQRSFQVHRQRRLSLAAAGLSLASGITAILLKDKADHWYDQYLTASVPEQRERFYHRTEDYDRCAGIATAVFEASFAVSFYYFLKSTRE